MLHKAANGGPFSSFAWIDAWMSAFRDDQAECRITVARDGDALVAALPGAVHRKAVSPRFDAVHRPHAAFLAHDRAGFHEILMAEKGAPGVAAIFDAMRQDKSAPFVDFTPVLPSPGVAAWTEVALRAGVWTHKRTEIRASVADLSDGWDAYFERRSPSLRKNLRRRARQIEADGGTFEVAEDVSPESLATLNAALDLSARSWKAQVGTDIGSTEAARRQFTELFKALAPFGQIRIHILRLRDQAAASSICLINGDTVYELVSDYDDAFNAYSPGRHTSAEAMRLAAERGAKTFDMLRSTHFTDGFADRHQDLVRIRTAFRPSLAQAIVIGDGVARRVARSVFGEQQRHQGRQKLLGDK